jgi:hypothetical protein
MGSKISMVMWHIHRSGILYILRKNVLLGVKKANISLQSSKTKFELQNQYSHVAYLSIGSFVYFKKKYTFRGQKGKHKPTELKNGISSFFMPQEF